MKKSWMIIRKLCLSVVFFSMTFMLMVTPDIVQAYDPDPVPSQKSGPNLGVSIDVGSVIDFLNNQHPKFSKKDMDVQQSMPNELVLLFASAPDKNQILSQGVNIIDSDFLAELSIHTVRVQFSERNETQQQLLEENLAQLDDILWVQKNYIFQSAGMGINIGGFNLSSGGSKSATTSPNKFDKKIHYGIPLIHATLESNKGSGQTIAIIDSLMDVKHKELKGAQIQQVKLVEGKPMLHATALASIMVGRDKIPGLVPAAKILSIATFSNSLTSDKKQRKNKPNLSHSYLLAKAMNIAMQKQSDVINLSFTGPRDKLLKRAVEQAVSKNIKVVAAAGNGGKKASMGYPGAIPSVFTVTGVDRKKNLYSYATRGATVDFAAPGVDVLAASTNNKYSLVSGTSFSCAYMSAALAMNPRLNYQGSALDLGDKGHDASFGYGLLQLAP